MKNITVKSDITIRQAMKKLNQTGEKCLIIADEEDILLGTLTDGDLRKAILKGATVGNSIYTYYHKNPIVVIEGKYDLSDAKNLFTQNKFDLIPVLDEKGKVVDLLFWDTVFKGGKNKQKGNLDIPVVIMAGGKGTRLEPFTKILPKPLIPIQEKPVIEHIIERFTDVGVDQFILTINYKSLILRAFFDELNPDYSVDFIEEEKPLGTAGSLKFLDDQSNVPFMVTNCDIIIKTDYLDLYKFHKKNGFDLTLVASMKNFTIPYGTCELNGEGHLKKINEKPEFDFLVNTGLYVLNPDVLQLIPDNQLYDITHLIEDAQKIGKKIGVYPIDDDNWIDIGQWSEYKKSVERL